MEIIEKIIGIIILAILTSSALWCFLGGFLEIYWRIRRNKRKEIFLDSIADSLAEKIICPVVEFISDLVDKIKWSVVERKTDLYVTAHKVLHRVIH